MKIVRKLLIGFLILTLMLCFAFCASAGTQESKYEYHDSSWYLSEKEATAFAGFIFNLAPEDLEGNDGARLVIDFLSGKYADSPEDDEIIKMAVCEIALTQINAKVENYDHASVITSENLIAWLQEQVGENPTEEFINSTCNDYLGKIKESINKVFLIFNFGEEVYENLNLAISGFETITGIPEKAQEYAKAAKAGIEAVIYAGSSSRSAMYKYFLSYVKTRDLANSTVDGFEFVMSCNVLTLVNQGLYDPFLNWAAEDNQKVLNRWAELMYWLTEDVGGVEFENDNTLGTTSSTLKPIEFVPGTGTYEGTCGKKIKWHLDASTGILNIYGEGSMYDYDSGNAPWYNYRQYINYVRVTDGVISIGNNAFYGCTTIDKVYLAADVYNIGNYAFSNCSAMRLFVIDGIVNNIGQYAFQNCQSLVYFNIPDSVTSINTGLFYGCTNLVHVEMSEDLVSIGGYAFHGCTSLASIEIPDSVTSIGDSGFYNCTGLKELTMPVSAKFIWATNEYYSFKGCTNIDTITLTKGTGTMQSYYPYNGPYGDIYRNTPWYISGCSTVIIEDGVTNIGNYAFEYCRSLKSITIPDSVTSIGDSAFYGCTSLESITIPDSVTIIDSATFYGCTNLVHIEMSEDLVSIDGYAFYDCRSLKSITIPDGVTSIGSSAFYNCTGLKELTMPVSAGNAAGNAASFKGCINIDKITLTKGMRRMPDYNSGTYDDTPWYISGCSTVILEDGVTNIGNYAFNGCRSLKSITIPDSVTSIGDSAFYGCTSLESITIPESVTSMGNSVFNGCTSLESITIPESVTSMGNAAFNGCTSLASIEIPDSVASIGDYAFYGCTSLASITIPESVTSMGNSVFNGCTSLESITIPDRVTSIGNYAFYDCARLKSITIPDSITSIGNYAFYYCGIKTVYYAGCKDNWHKITINGGNSCLTKATIHYNGCDGKIASKVISELNCTTNRVTEYRCACESLRYETIDYATGHSHDSTITTPATHLTEGVITYTCGACGDTFTETIEKLTEHTYYVTETIYPTCVTEGYSIYTCECGSMYYDDYVDCDYYSHISEDGDIICDYCGERTSDCSCNCHSTSGFIAFIWKILRFFYKIFGTNSVCSCGIAHY